MANRSTGVAIGDNQQSRYTGTLVRKLAGNLQGYQPLNANLTSISAIPTNVTGVITVVNGVYSSSTLALIGDVTGNISTTSTTLTLATVNANVGTFGDASHTLTMTVNAKGLITAISANAITAASIGSGTIDGARLPAFTHSGDATGTFNQANPGNVPITLATVNSNVGTYNSVTVNAKGLVTAASNVIQAPSYQAIISGVGQTVFNTSVNTVTNKVMVFNLRTKQIEGIDYTVTGANQITFGTGITVGNTVEFYSFA